MRIGGDTIIPLIPRFSYNATYEWIEVANGLYASTDFLYWVFMFDILKNLGLTLYQAGFAFQFLIFFLSGFGLYKIFNLFNKESKLFGLIAAIAFIYSPHRYDHMVYFYASASSIWLIYFLIKFLKNKRLSLLDCVLISALIGFLGNLPNPKYHFLVFLTYTIAIAISLLTRLLSLKDIKNNLKNFFAIILMTSYISLPLLYFGITFAGSNDIAIRTTNELGGAKHALDFGAAYISQMIRLWHTPSMNPPERDLMDEPLLGFSYFIIPILVLTVIPLILKTFDKVKQRVYFILYFLAIFFVLLAKSSNPPVGYFYDWLVLSSKIFAFLRTSAGIVIYAGIFYALLYGIIVQYFFYRIKINKLFFLSLSVFLILIPGYHIWSGKYFLNYSPVNPYVDKKAYGLRVPKEYFDSAYFLTKLRLDSKIDVLGGAQGYQNNKWGYYGFLIYPWLLDKPIISFNKLQKDGLTNSFLTNARYIYHDKTILIDEKENKLIKAKYQITGEIFSENNISILRKSDESFLPHLFVPQELATIDRLSEKLLLSPIYWQAYTAYIDDKDKSILTKFSKKFIDQPIVEYKKINPTKYRIRIHKAHGSFPLIFNENFNNEWQIYMNDLYQRNSRDLTKDLSVVDNLYKIFDLNEEDQASTDELKLFIQTGMVSTLGDFAYKEKKHYIFTNGREIPDYNEKYAIDFVSKDFFNTIQNNNLPEGYPFEAFFKKPLDNSKYHFRANTFANGWVIDPVTLCTNTQLKCIINDDGSYDLELIIEFWPQRMAYVGQVISGLVMFAICSFLIIESLSRRYRNYGNK